ncbi:MAG: hypothetical protein E7261_05265 [Lachnospiraceae bacterium]|nr:hypothetical protein [Lachnospiraceae bacterium]
MGINKKIPILCIVAGIILAGVAAVTSGSGREAVTRLKRPSVGEGKEEYEINVLYDGIEKNITVPVEERQLEFAEARELLDAGLEEVLRIVEAENGDLSEVKRDLNLPAAVFDGMVSVSWRSSDRDYINDNGILNREGCRYMDETGQIVVMAAEVSVQEYRAELEVPVRISPDFFSEEEKKENLIFDAIEKENDKSARDDYVGLPSEVEGKEALYYTLNESGWWKYIVLGVMAAMISMLFTKQQQDNAKKLRDKELKLAFAPIITKLTLLIGAGMSIRGAWEKIVNDYKKDEKKNAAYEEMSKVYNEMQNGLSEGQAYVLFGKRSGLSSYVKLGNLLEQNLRKGTKGLTERLEHEVWEAFEERKALAYRLGEEAGTKLLLPMIMSLGIIIAFCVIPAFLNM